MEKAVNGTHFEDMFLGAHADLLRYTNTGIYLNYRSAIDEVKNTLLNNNYDPTKPGTNVSRKLRTLVAKKLHLKDHNSLKFYPSVGGSLDHHHGVDCFMELDGKMVTLDLTIRDSKQSYKANVLVTEDELTQDRNAVADKIVHAFN